MSLLVLPKTAATLSALEIDVDKDWQGFGITNLKGLAAGMQKGDVLSHDGTRMVKLPPINIGDELTSGGASQMPSWQAPPAP
jgi:hypothetical protein